jgi:hypothetical protein
VSTREQLYSSLPKELLGPRGSVSEILADDPRDEYVTGVLEPKGVVREDHIFFIKFIDFIFVKKNDCA